MSILELIADVLGFLGAPSADRDHSIVGQSKMEERTASFWHRLFICLLLAAGTAALYVWVLQPSFASA